MPKGSVKLGEKVRSPWHDGWDIKFCKVKCAIHKANGMASGPAWTLTPEVQQFVELIYSERLMKAHLESQHTDLDKMPLGSDHHTPGVGSRATGR